MLHLYLTPLILPQLINLQILPLFSPLSHPQILIDLPQCPLLILPSNPHTHPQTLGQINQMCTKVIHHLLLWSLFRKLLNQQYAQLRNLTTMLAMHRYLKWRPLHPPTDLHRPGNRQLTASKPSTPVKVLVRQTANPAILETYCSLTKGTTNISILTDPWPIRPPVATLFPLLHFFLGSSQWQSLPMSQKPATRVARGITSKRAVVNTREKERAEGTRLKVTDLILGKCSTRNPQASLEVARSLLETSVHPAPPWLTKSPNFWNPSPNPLQNCFPTETDHCTCDAHTKIVLIIYMLLSMLCVWMCVLTIVINFRSLSHFARTLIVKTGYET